MSRFVVLVLSLHICETEFTRPQSIPPPQNVKVLERKSTSALLTWESGSDVKFTRYLVTMIDLPNSAEIELPSNEDQVHRLIKNLHPGQYYQVAIAGITEKYQLSSRTIHMFFAKPLPPYDLRLEPLSGIRVVIGLPGLNSSYDLETAGVRLVWSSPSRAETNIEGFDVRINSDEESQNQLQALSVGDALDNSRAFANLIPGIKYSFSVRSYVGWHNHVFSVPVTESIILPPLPPVGAIIVKSTGDQVTLLAFGPKFGIYDQLLLTLNPSNGIIKSTSRAGESILGRTHEYIITKLLPKTQYFVKILSLSQGVKSKTFASLKFISKLKDEAKLKVSNFNTSSVTLQWLQEPQLAQKEVEYLIEIKDTRISNEPPRIVFVKSSRKNVAVVIKRLISGVIYSFSLHLIQNGNKSEKGYIEQSTVPPKPRLKALFRFGENLVGQVFQPDVGHCPQYLVTYNPSLPGETSSRIQTLNTGKVLILLLIKSISSLRFLNMVLTRVHQNFTLSGIPSHEIYSIHLRCVNQHVEGEALVVSSEATVDQSTGEIHEKQQHPRLKLSCAKPKKVHGKPNFGFTPHDACCGNRPIRTTAEKCCGNSVLPVDSESLCCTKTFYSPSSDICCKNAFVSVRNQGCKDANPLYYSGIEA